MKGTLHKTDKWWIVKYKEFSRVVKVHGIPVDTEYFIKELPLHPDERVELRNCVGEIEFVIVQPFNISQPELKYAKIVQPNNDGWTAIIELYGTTAGVPEDALEFWNWLRENYEVPLKKK